MPIHLIPGSPSLLIRRSAFERAGLTRAQVDERLNLTDEEFQVEGELICVGPIAESEGLSAFIEELEAAGLAHYDDFFDFSGNWPEWLRIYVGASARGH